MSNLDEGPKTKDTKDFLTNQMIRVNQQVIEKNTKVVYSRTKSNTNKTFVIELIDPRIDGKEKNLKLESKLKYIRIFVMDDIEPKM